MLKMGSVTNSERYDCPQSLGHLISQNHDHTQLNQVAGKPRHHTTPGITLGTFGNQYLKM